MSAAHKVLTQPELFTLLLTYLSGFPCWLRDGLKAILNPPIRRYHVDTWMNEMVLKRGDIAGLRRLLVLMQHNKWYSHPPLVSLVGIVWRAVELSQCALADWILDHSEREGLVTKSNPIDYDSTKMLHAAVHACRLETIEWVVARFPTLLSGPPVPSHIMLTAINNGALPVLQWLIRHSLHCQDSLLVIRAVESGHLDVLRLLLDSGYEPCALEYALYAKRGRYPCQRLVEMAQLLLDRGADRAANEDRWMLIIEREMNVDLLRFLHANELLPRIRRQTQHHLIRWNRADEIRFLLQHDLMQSTSTELHLCIEQSNDSTEVLRVLLQYSSRGCLVKARKRAIDRGFRAVEAELTRWIDPSVTECEERNHGSRAKRRRCQREPPLTTDEQ
ncbi:hypothetical protein PINS_up002852 [Pythium insidiosum]|nr:hypothetical protein PINS_up002852 [Pythium insidiosum]